MLIQVAGVHKMQELIPILTSGITHVGLPLGPGVREQDLRLTFSDALVEHISTEGFDQQYGARHLQRTIEQTVVGELAHELLDRPDLEGSTLLVDYAEGELRFRRPS